MTVKVSLLNEVKVNDWFWQGWFKLSAAEFKTVILYHFDELKENPNVQHLIVRI